MRSRFALGLVLLAGSPTLVRGADLLAVPRGGMAAGPVAEVMCGGCHRRDGAGPPLAGQDRLYLAKQLHDYASGARPNDVMGPIAKAIPKEERAAAADYYAGLPPPKGLAPAANEAGARLATRGDPPRGLVACDSCHAPAAIDRPPASPVLAGMAAPYLAAQLRLWQAGVRRNDPMGRMAQIAAVLSEAEIAAVAEHYAGLAPPAGS